MGKRPPRQPRCQNTTAPDITVSCSSLIDLFREVGGVFHQHLPLVAEMEHDRLLFTFYFAQQRLQLSLRSSLTDVRAAARGSGSEVACEPGYQPTPQSI